MARYRIAQLNELSGVPCPCGTARRAFAMPDNTTATVHLTEISVDARVHYHKRMTEIYVIYEGHGHLELDGERVPVKPLTAIMISPGCRHRAVAAPGQTIRAIIVPVPPFDPEDEWFD